jgi:hypothetical protein
MLVLVRPCYRCKSQANGRPNMHQERELFED